MVSHTSDRLSDGSLRSAVRRTDDEDSTVRWTSSSVAAGFDGRGRPSYGPVAVGFDGRGRPSYGQIAARFDGRGRPSYGVVLVASLLATILGVMMSDSLWAQAYGEADRQAPGDAMIQAYLQNETLKISGRFLPELGTRDQWEAGKSQREREYFHMLGLWPKPSKTPLKATITGTYEGDGYVVDNLHYQSRPQLYVTGNLYRPADTNDAARRPAILYVCGHSYRERNGNKTAYQSHGIWFARHGYVCLVLDTLQLGEIAAIHHGTYREQRWWWHSRGYTSAGVECWNGIRGIDYLLSRSDVDPDRIAVTGISGGGAATFWIAAADERVSVAVPVSGMADLPSYVTNRVVNGHCDCMFLYNTFQWPWTRIAAMIAPRPMLFVNSDADAIFPMDANQRVINRLERVYSLYGAGDRVDSLVSIGGHAYRKDIRRGAYRFINEHLQSNVEPVDDSEVDLVTGSRGHPLHPIDPKLLRVFPSDADLPDDELNTTIDQVFVPLAKVDVPSSAEFADHKTKLLGDLREYTFRYFPDVIPAAERVDRSEDRDGNSGAIRTEDKIVIPVVQHVAAEQAKRIVLLVANSDSHAPLPAWLNAVITPGDAVYCVEPRGIGKTHWTSKGPPNYVLRSHVLLGRTVDTGRVWDVIATVKLLRGQHPDAPVLVAGDQAGSVLAAYAAIVDDDIDELLLHRPIESHMDATAPQLLNVLRTCDIPDAIGLFAPKPLTLVEGADGLSRRVAEYYDSAAASERLQIGE